MVVYPLSTFEMKTVRWAARIVPAVAIALVLLLQAISLAATGV